MRILSVGSEIFVRRSDNNSLNTSEFEFMNDDNTYLPVDPYMSSTLNVMLSAGRTRVKIGNYEIQHCPIGGLSQTNIFTGKRRKLRIARVSTPRPSSGTFAESHVGIPAWFASLLGMVHTGYLPPTENECFYADNDESYHGECIL